MDIERVKQLVKSGKTYNEISEILKSDNPNNDMRGFSARSVRWFCHNNQIDKKNLFGKDKLDQVVMKEVSEVI